MTKEARERVIQELILIDLDDAILYFDEEGSLEAVFSARPEPEPGTEENITV